MRPIQVWRFDEAPEEYQRLATRGGDEDWLAVVPKEYGQVAPSDDDPFAKVTATGKPWIGWLDGSGFDSCCEAKWIDNGDVWLVVGSH